MMKLTVKELSGKKLVLEIEPTLKVRTVNDGGERRCYVLRVGACTDAAPADPSLAPVHAQ